MKTQQVTPQIISVFQTTSDNRLFSVLDEMIEGVQIFDENLNYLYINKTAEKQNQKTKEELLGKNYLSSWPGIEKTLVYKMIQQSLAEQKTIRFENKFKFPNGSFGLFFLSIQPFDNGIIILSLESKSRMILMQETENNEKLYRSLFENLLNGFAYCKMISEKDKLDDFMYLSVNQAFERLTGLKNVIGKKVTEVIPGIQESDPQLIATYKRVSETGKPETFEVYVEALHMWFFVSVYSPEKGYFVAIFDVITERKNVESKLHEQLEELQRWYSATIDREQRSIELKKEVNQLLMELGKPPKYLFADKSQDILQD